jgi:hypothetical protein
MEAEKNDHNRQIRSKIRTCGNLGLKHSFFLSHYQENAGDIAAILNLRLTSSTDLKCWFDQFAEHVNLDGMVRGIVQSAIFLLILTKGVLLRPWVQLEIRTAILLSKTVVILYETDSRKPGYCESIKDYFADAPPDIVAFLSNIEARPFRRKAYEQEVMLQQVLEECSDDLLRANKAKKPMQILDVDPSVLGGSDADLAACYVDLGSGQTMIYLFAIAADSSLHYDLIYEDNSGCFLDKDEATLAQVRPEFIKQFASIYEKLNSYPGRSIENLFTVFIGGTSKFRNAKKEDPKKVEAVEVWFKGVVAESQICDAREEHAPSVKFGTVEGTEEARFEWLAIKQACLENLDEPNCACSAGNGSLQCSMDNIFLTVDCELKAGEQHVKDNGVPSYQELIASDIEGAFGKIGASLSRLRGDGEPLRLVLISSFYYASLACKVVQKGEVVHYRDLEDVVGPAKALLADESAKAKDRAHVARMLKVLDVVTERDHNNVKVLIVREWTVRGKEYKATWLTGKFIESMKLKYLSASKSKPSASAAAQSTYSRR